MMKTRFIFKSIYAHLRCGSIPEALMEDSLKLIQVDEEPLILFTAGRVYRLSPR